MVRIVDASLIDASHLVVLDGPLGPAVVERSIAFRVFVPDTPGTYPLVIYSHGQRGDPSAAAGTHPTVLAEAGHVVVAPFHLDSRALPEATFTQFGGEDRTLYHRVADIQFLLDQVEAIQTLLPDTGIDARAPVMAGQSQGARTGAYLTGAVSVRAGFEPQPGNQFGLESLADPRFAAAILSGPVFGDGNLDDFGLASTSFAGVTVPTLWVTGTEDEVTGSGDYRDALEVFEAAAGERYAVVLDGGTHGDVGGRTASEAQVRAATAPMIDFLDYITAGDQAAAARLVDSEGRVDGEPEISEAYAGAPGQAPTGALAPNGEGVATGLAGTDTLLLEAGLADLELRAAEGGFTAVVGEQAVAVAGIERIALDDAALRLDRGPAAVDASLFYEAAYDRPGDVVGLSFWAAAIDGGRPVGEVADAFAASPEYLAIYGSAASDEDYVTRLYVHALGRGPDPGGLTFWTQRLADGRLDRGDVLALFALSDEIRDTFANETDDGLWLLA